VSARRRFYREVTVNAVPTGEGGCAGYSVLLDGKPVRTPAGAVLVLPTAMLAEAIAREWGEQGDTLRPEAMVLTKLANTAIDRIGPNRHEAIAQILAFAKSDVLCYRAETPKELVERQKQEWDPILQWAETRYGAALVCGAGIAFIEQSPTALAALQRAMAALDDFILAGLYSATPLLGSAVIALALLDGRLAAGQAFAAAHLDEIHQVERWGQDSEAQELQANKIKELSEMARFFILLGGSSGTV
jgi:chaperone required for assembly of F1-ATPase